MLRVHHYFPLGSGNVGDLLVAKALRACIRRHFGSCEFVDRPVNDRYDGEDEVGLLVPNVERSNREADLVLLGGSNLLEPRKPRRAGLLTRRRGRWGVFTTTDAISHLQTPLLCIGMGTGSDFGRSIRRYREPTISEIRAIARKALGFAVRDEPTRRGLQEIGVESICTGCPVTFWTNRPVEPADAAEPLIVSFPSTGNAAHLRGRQYLRRAALYLQWLKDSRTRFIVSIHDKEDLATIGRWLPHGCEIFYSENLEEIEARYENCRGVVGFRLHAALLGLGLGKPIVPVAVDWRGRGFIQTFGLHEFAATGGGWRSFAQLRKSTELLLAGDPELIGRLSCAKIHWINRFEEFLFECARTLRRARPIAA